MIYKITHAGTIVRTSDGATIPAHEGNGDYREFLRWKAAGNEPLPVDPPREPTPLEKIIALEAQQTPRLLREAALGGEYAIEKLSLLDGRIAELRASIK